MKNVITLLIGIIIGIVATYFLLPDNRVVSSKPSPMLFKTLGMKPGDMKVQDVSTEELYIGLWENNTQTIVSKKHPDKQVEIFTPPRKDAMAAVCITDRSGQSFTFYDKGDGFWDFSILEGNGDTYFYNQMGGFPGRINRKGQHSIARIGEEYYPLRLINRKRYIERGGKLVEVVMVNAGLIKIKEGGDVYSMDNPPKEVAEELGRDFIGGAPLPVPLTKKMDDQLVKEGILPPQ